MSASCLQNGEFSVGLRAVCSVQCGIGVLFHHVLNLTATLLKLATVNRSVISDKINIVRIRSTFLPLWHLIFLQCLCHRLVSSAHRIFCVR